MPRLAFLLPASLLFTGCAPVLEVSFAEGGIWDFYLFDDPDATGDFVVLAEGLVSVRDELGAPLPDAVTNQGDGLWRIDVEPEQVVDVVATGPSHVPTVRRMPAPTTTAQFSVPLHPRSQSIVPLLMDAVASVEELGFPDSQALLAGETAGLVVQPLQPEAWVDAEVFLVDGEGNDVAQTALTQAEDGSYGLAQGRPVDMLLASDVAPGLVTLTVRPSSGPEVVQAWFAAPGELIDGRYFALASED